MKTYLVKFTIGCSEKLNATSLELARKIGNYYETIGFFPQIKSIKLWTPPKK